MKSKKSQIQTMETIAIMLIFFVILIIGFIFYLRISSYSQSDKVSKVQELESIRVSQTISYLPELQCSSKNIVEDNCFDVYKLNAFLEMKNNETNFNKTYYPFFYYSNITVQKVYPETQQSWNIYNKVGRGGSFKTLIPILIYDPTTDKNSFGVLTVQSYNVE